MKKEFPILSHQVTVRTLLLLLTAISPALAQWPAPTAPAVPAADGYAMVPGVAMPPGHATTYRAIFDATHAADKPSQLVPALNMAGSELNALAAAHIPLDKAQFVIVFHGPAADGILDDAHYKTKFRVENPI